MSHANLIDFKGLPLIIDAVVVPTFPGIIGISSCPGMKDFSTLDLYEDTIENDLECIRNWGASVVVTLLEMRELVSFGVADLPEKALEMNLRWIHLPLNNMGLPDEVFEEKWQWAGPMLQKFLREGQRILIHCKQGVGRSGIVTARLLIESGIKADSAIRIVRKARPGSLLLSSQEEYCYSLASKG